MGQIFCACAYDTETKTCCVVNADKFHANCYSYSGAVLSMHYLLRQKPYRVMWGGDYIVIDDALESVSREEDLLGISTYEDFEDFERNCEDLENKSYYDKAKFIKNHTDTWTHIRVEDEAVKYFDYNNTKNLYSQNFHAPFRLIFRNSAKKILEIRQYYCKFSSPTCKKSARKFTQKFCEYRF